MNGPYHGAVWPRMNQVYNPHPGDSITNTASAMVALAVETNDTVTASFNDITITATSATPPGDVVAAYWSESTRRREAYEASPEHAARLEAAKEAQRVKDSELAEALKSAPEAMTVSPAPDGDTWERCVSINTDPYSAGVIAFTALWGRLMEGQLAAGKTLAECARKMSRVADTEGITGFMYGCAVSFLAKFWVHGEELRRWHNIDTQIGKEGEKANASGGVLNPALLNIGA